MNRSAGFHEHIHRTKFDNEVHWRGRMVKSQRPWVAPNEPSEHPQPWYWLYQSRNYNPSPVTVRPWTGLLLCHAISTWMSGYDMETFGTVKYLYVNGSRDSWQSQSPKKSEGLVVWHDRNLFAPQLSVVLILHCSGISVVGCSVTVIWRNDQTQILGNACCDRPGSLYRRHVGWDLEVKAAKSWLESRIEISACSKV